MLRTLRPCFGFAVQAFNPAKNYYKILEVEETAQQDRIKTSFKSLAKRYHPDVNKGKEEQFKEVNEAYQVLSDQPTKREYDAARQTASHPQANSHPYSQHPYSQQNPSSQEHPYYQQGGFNPRQQGFNHSQRSYNEHPSWQNPNQHNSGQYGGWASRDQWLYEIYRQQQEEFMKQYQQAQRQRFERGSNRGGRSPIEDQYQRRFMEEMMAREQFKRTKEELRNERERQAREEQQRLERQYAESKRKLRDVGRVLVQDVKDIGKAVWDLWLYFKSKK